MDNSLAEKIQVILKNQHTSGSFVSCPNFELYRYCWLRDGSFTAAAMDMAGYHESADRYFKWTNSVIAKQAKKVNQIIKAIHRHEPLLNNEYLSSRFTLEGDEVNDDWPNFQLDGYGIWLWALGKHFDASNNTDKINEYMQGIKLIVEYLIELWGFPNYNCWEENGEQINTSTLACIYGGLSSISRCLKLCSINEAPGEIDETTGKINEVAANIKQFVLENCVYNGRLTAYTGSDSIDSSLLWAAVPFGMLDVHDDVFSRTVDEIETKLLHGCGLYRYCNDTYYGGGQWLLMSCWLGWYYSLVGKPDKAEAILEWAKNQANENGELPEQSFEHVNDSSYFDKWYDMFGKPATPALWAHALYVILALELKKGPQF